MKKKGDEENFENDTASLKNIASETSAHGIRNIFSSNRYSIVRLIWLLGVLASMILLAITLYDVAIKYYTYPFLTASHTMPKHELNFPAVTVCDINPYNTDDYQYAQGLKDLMVELTLPGFTAPVDMTQHPYNIVVNTSVKELEDETSPWVDEYFVLCVWDGVMYPCHQIFKPVYTLMGKCYVFNGNATSRRTTKQIGSSSGLRVIYQVDQANGVLTSDYSAGLKLHLHEPHEMPDFLTEGFVVSTGHSTNVAITQNNFRFLTAPYKAFGDESCEDTDSPNFPVKVNYSETYSYSACLSECVGPRAVNACQCKQFTQTDSDVPYCTFLQGAQCFMPHYVRLNTEARTNDTCGCPRPCSFTRYQTRMSLSAFPSLATGQLLVRVGLANSTTEAREDFGEFRIYYEDLMLYETKHEAQYTINSIMATVGGQMGFFLGASLLTVAEFIEFVIILFGRLCRGTVLKFSNAGKMTSTTNIVQVKPISSVS